MGDPEEVPGSWLHTGSVVAIWAAWGVTHQMEDLPLFLSSSLYISDFAIKNKVNLKSLALL